ncbi:MAG: hypothetical protein EBZ29_06675 [Synechococcaceae bacterium WB9_4xC_028]|nr:hypothetical protein [Synechococcaceae bacterium WB9_4xC_028]
MSDCSGSSSRHTHQRIVQERTRTLLTQLDQDHLRRRMALEPQRAAQVDQEMVQTFGSWFDPQSLNRPRLLWNRSHGDD